MGSKLRQIGQNLRGSLWFTPSVLVLMAIVLAFGMIALDRAIGIKMAITLPLVFDADPDGARAVLSTIASSVLTVASVSFSITVLVFSFASAQYSSRTLRNFMEDRTNKLVLGTLLATVVYCLLVLRTIHGNNPTYITTVFVPALSVTVALLLALLDLGLFTFLIHHIAESFQAASVIKRVADELSKAIDQLYPQQLGQGATEAPAAAVASNPDQGTRIPAERAGYLQEIDATSLLDLAGKHDLLIVIEKQVGSYVVAGETLARAIPEERVTQAICAHISAFFAYGPHRTVDQDARFGFIQLTDIATKALSPGINDPTTAVMCLDQISRLLRQLANRSFPAQTRCDPQGAPRVIAPRPGFATMVDQCFDPLRRYGMADAAIPIKMIQVLGAVAAEINDADRLNVLAEHADSIIEAAGQHTKLRRDQRLVAAAVGDLPLSLQLRLTNQI
ncbi:MAG: DUF2254 domain-containing protein [Chloroflexota bacterium]|nr:DUF2254 domain-containing protein [Chloroflexota bacterium]